MTHKTTIEQDLVDLCEIFADPMKRIFPPMSSTDIRIARLVIALACGEPIDLEYAERLARAKGNKQPWEESVIVEAQRVMGDVRTQPSDEVVIGEGRGKG